LCPAVSQVVAGQLTPAMSEFGSDNGEHLAGDLVPHVDGPPQDLSEEMFRALVSSGDDENKVRYSGNNYS
jgi:hypothetical protein